MIRKGRYALWQGEEYEFISYQRQYYLKSRDQTVLKKGFSELSHNSGIFVRKVTIKELEDAYEIVPYVMIAGYRFAVEGCNDTTSKVVLVTNNPFVQKKVNVRPYGKYEYIIELPHEEVQIIEDRIPILGFENSLN